MSDNLERPADDAVLANDLLEGAEAIGRFMGLPARAIYHQKNKLPVFLIGSKIFARKSTIIKWIQDQENKRLAS